jgi:hypothetical protein
MQCALRVDAVNGLGAADAWDEILDGPVGPSRGHLGATQPPDTAANAKAAWDPKIALLSEKPVQPQTAAKRETYF